MASTEVLSALESLHRELEKLEPAIKHVKAAQEVTRAVKGIPIKHLELLKEVKEIDARHKQELKVLFSQELVALTAENIKLANSSVIVLKEIKEIDVKHKQELKDQFSKELVKITEETIKLANTTSAIQKQVQVEQLTSTKLKDKVQIFHDKVEKINFPERLDKLDANVAGIMAGLQSVQSRLDGLERNIIDRLRDLGEYQKESREINKTGVEEIRISVLESLRKSYKQQHTAAQITWGLILLSIGFLGVLILLRLLGIKI